MTTTSPAKTNAQRPGRRTSWREALSNVGLPLAVLGILAIWAYTRAEEAQKLTNHLHAEGLHGGTIVSLAGDQRHAEAVVDAQGQLHVFTLGEDESIVLDVPEQSLTAFVSSDDGPAIQVSLEPAPQQGDRPGRTSRFTGELPEELEANPTSVTISSLDFGSERYRLAFQWDDRRHETPMPDKVVDDAERALYLIPGGVYTEEDVDANGRMTASEKYRAFKAQHDFNPQSGDKICPITRTKANPACTWVIGGQQYEFCCPPCIDEFLQLAKSEPTKIGPPSEYVR